jgi:enamine deaminase RidA (YjgF/YER057c/UK114 family)
MPESTTGSEIAPSRTPGVAVPIGRYSHVKVIPPGHSTVYISGQVGTDVNGTLVGLDAESQTRQVLANIEAILKHLGAVPSNIVKLLTFLAGEEHAAGFYAARDAVFDAWYPDGSEPAHSLAIVSALAETELTVEMEAVVGIAVP